jgi:hypothetical protein
MSDETCNCGCNAKPEEKETTEECTCGCGASEAKDK